MQGRSYSLPVLITFLFLFSITSGFANASACGTVPASLSNVITACYPINIVNTQSAATPVNFQQMFSNLPFNALAGNVVVYNGISGTLLPAWVESNSVVWVNLGANTIPASSSANGIYYFGIGASGTNFFPSGNDIGEAPQLSPTYGEYDNGANVFNDYWNFVGNSLPAGWAANTISTDVGNSGSYAVNNGFSITDTNGNDIYMNCNSGVCINSYDAEFVYSKTKISGNFILESQITSQGDSNSWAKAGLVLQNTNTVSTNNGEAMLFVTPGNGVAFQWQGSPVNTAPDNNSNGNSYTFPTYLQFVSNSSGVGAFTGTSYTNTKQQGTFINAIGRAISQYFGFIITSHNTSASSTATFQNWIRVRSYPPSGIMPTASVGSISTLSLSISPNPVYVGQTSTVTATCTSSTDSCAVDSPLGTHLATGTGTATYIVPSTMSAGSYTYYANDLSTGVVSSGETLDVVQKTSPSAVPSNTVYYAPITITNSQSSATPAQMPQMINISESNFSSYISYSNNTADFEYFYSNGTVIPSWIEGNTLGKIRTWAKINPSIAAGGAYQIFIGFAQTSNNLLSSSGTTGIGEAPQLSSTYAQYDDGASVFGMYDNFEGTSLNTSKWSFNADTVSPACTSFPSKYYIDNGATISGDYCAAAVLTKETFNISRYTMEGFTKEIESGNAYCNAVGGYGMFSSNNILTVECSASTKLQNNNGVSGNSVVTSWSSPLDGVISVWTHGSVSYASYDYGQTYQNAVDFPKEQFLTAAFGSNWDSTFYQWVRTRLTPPSGVMPSTAFGPVSGISSVSYNAPTISQPSISNSTVDVGQTETISAMISGGVPNYYGNAIITNSGTVTNSIAVSSQSGTYVSESWIVSSNEIGTETGNFVLTDGYPTPFNSISSASFNVNSALVPTSISSPSSAMSVYTEQPLTITVAQPTTGSAPYTYTWSVASGASCPGNIGGDVNSWTYVPTGTSSDCRFTVSVKDDATTQESYTANTPDLTVESARCGNLPASISGEIAACYPINIVNTQSAATPVNFQQMFSNLPFNALAGNVVVYNGISGTLLPAWVESNSVVWVNLGANTIPASSSANGIYYFGIGASGTNFFPSGNDIGEAPQLSPTYGEYDNGANVFNDYWNFVGNSLPGSFGIYGSASGVSYSVNNGLTFSFTASGYDAVYYNTEITNGQLLDYFVPSVSLTQDYDSGAFLQNVTPGTGSIDSCSGVTTGLLFEPHENSTFLASGARIREIDSGSNVILTSGTGASIPDVITGYWPNSGTASVYTNYNESLSIAPYLSYPGNAFFGISAGTCASPVSGSITYQWARTRTAPPGNTMPSTSLNQEFFLPSISQPTINRPRIDVGQTETISAMISGGVPNYYGNAIITNSGTVTNSIAVSSQSSTYVSESWTVSSNEIGTETGNFVLSDSRPTPFNSTASPDFTVSSALQSTGISSPASALSAYDGQSYTISVATPTTGTSPYTYAWAVNAGSSCPGFSNPGSSNSFTYTPSGTSSNCEFAVTVNDSATEPESYASNTPEITISSSLAANSISPTYPTVNEGQSVTLTAGASGGAPAYSFEWYIGSACNTTTGYSGLTYSPAPSYTTRYSFKVTDTVGEAVCSYGDIVLVNQTQAVSTGSGSGGPAYYTDIFNDNVENTSNSDVPVFSISIVNTHTGNSTEEYLYQNQLPASVSFTGGHMLRFSAACSFVSNGKQYVFTNGVYGAGTSCNSTFSSYGGQSFIAQYSQSVQTTSSTVQPTVQQTTSISSTLPAVPTSLTTTVPQTPGNNETMHETLNVSNATVSKFSFNEITLSIRSLRPGNNTIGVTVRNLTPQSEPSLPSNYTSLYLFNMSMTPSSGISSNITAGYNCALQPSLITPFILVNGSWSRVNGYLVSQSTCTVTFSAPDNATIGIFEIAPSTVKNTEKPRTVFFPIYYLIFFITVALIIILIVAARRRARKNRRLHK